MHVVSNEEGAAPRVFENDAATPSLVPAHPLVNAKMDETGFFGGNGMAIFIGLIFGIALLGAAAAIFERYEASHQSTSSAPRLIEVATAHLSTEGDTSAPPAPLTVQISDNHIRVTAISLGHPRLAVINGHTVAEGDSLTIRTPTAHVQVRLKVLRIADGHIELSDGTQVIRARIGVADKPDRTASGR